jgi:tetratricopeptide (TPR) repeat protein
MSKKSRQEEERNRFHERTILLGDQALTHYHAERYAEALRVFEEVSTRYAQLKMFFLVADTRITMGDIYVKQGLYHDALRMHKHAFTVCQQNYYVDRSARAADAVGCDLQDLAEYGTAVNWHATAASLYAQFGDSDRARIALQNRAVAEQQAGLS